MLLLQWPESKSLSTRSLWYTWWVLESESVIWTGYHGYLSINCAKIMLFPCVTCTLWIVLIFWQNNFQTRPFPDEISVLFFFYFILNKTDYNKTARRYIYSLVEEWRALSSDGVWVLKCKIRPKCLTDTKSHCQAFLFSKELLTTFLS